MSLIPTIFQSTDPGAPQLSGTVGSLISVLRAMLVSGYGTGDAAKPGLGWTEAFTSTNKAVFKNSPVTGTGYHLRVLDDGSAAAGGSARSATLRGYSSMTDIDTGPDPVPTAAQRANGAIWVKSTALDATSRVWWAIGNERCFYLFMATSAATQELQNACPQFAGDISSYLPGDGYRFMVSGSPDNSYSGSESADQTRLFVEFGSYNDDPNPATAAGFIGRGYQGSAGALPVSHLDSPSIGSALGQSTGGYPYPYPVNQGMLWERAVLQEDVYIHRGFMPGIVVPLHDKPFVDLQELADLPSMPAGTKLLAKTFAPRSPYWRGYSNGQVLFETGREWQ